MYISSEVIHKFDSLVLNKELCVYVIKDQFGLRDVISDKSPEELKLTLIPEDPREVFEGIGDFILFTRINFKDSSISYNDTFSELTILNKNGHITVSRSGKRIYFYVSGDELKYVNRLKVAVVRPLGCTAMVLQELTEDASDTSSQSNVQ